MSLKNLLRKEPVAIGTALVAVLNALVLLGVLSLTAAQLGGINTAVVLVLGLFTRNAVTPNASVLVGQSDVRDSLPDGTTVEDVLGNVGQPAPETDTES
jgi:hypothetical protein